MSSSEVVSLNMQLASTQESKPKKRICCACPDTKRLRDECIAEHGPEHCGKWIEAHLQCLRSEGFNVLRIYCCGLLMRLIVVAGFNSF
ncbi:hypothetical protein KP509_20G030600 [Ceratopteris richardii]|uniref:Cytochrome c oxidase copper chaperone n=1 Tax=Ceratopteris richardii TaxID=49495 RepID=A0A8T2SG99_CERRI|nr:hypothetical protein KP509_20G030600 [Ceratopteris richardii]